LREIQLPWIEGQPYISPQGDKVAFVAALPSPRLIVATVTGKEITSIDWTTAWGIRPDGWFNEEWLRLPRTEGAPTTIRLVSPWSGELRVLEPQLPNVHPDAARQYAAATFSPDLDLVVYMRLDDETYQGQFMLWDLRQGGAIWSSESGIRQSHAMFTFPSWSPDGSMIALTDAKSKDTEAGLRRQDIVVLSRDGQVAARTDFSDTFHVYWIGQQLLWSPDGRKLAFWLLPLDGDTSRLYRLYVFDVSANLLIDTCLENDDIPDAVWSPDGRLLAAIESVSHQRSLVVLNPTAGSATTFSSFEPLELIGWAASP
jgi:Tol biopolymer transport system component